MYVCVYIIKKKYAQHSISFRELCSKDLSMTVIDWLQTCEFIRGRNRRLFFIRMIFCLFLENSEPFTLYCICGGLIGLIIILICIILLLTLGKYFKFDSKSSESDYAEAPAYLPIYRYNGRNHSGLYQV